MALAGREKFSVLSRNGPRGQVPGTKICVFEVPVALINVESVSVNCRPQTGGEMQTAE